MVRNCHRITLLDAHLFGRGNLRLWRGNFLPIRPVCNTDVRTQVSRTSQDYRQSGDLNLTEVETSESSSKAESAMIEADEFVGRFAVTDEITDFGVYCIS